jgi:UDP-N-acetylglucosamine 4,6-dehydratase/5-epimerase
MENKHIFIFGGSGSLGNALIRRYLPNNYITVYSRDENKHWSMNLHYKTDKISYIIGDIRDKSKVKQSLIRSNPHHVIIASALKHIEKCEYESNESIETNLLGTKNVVDTIETQRQYLTNIESVCFISTDKACSPVNLYGMCKAMSEGLMIEKSKYVTDIKFVTVRYGNVLNSRGSIIPILHNIGRNKDKMFFSLTDERMTRFIMSLDESVDLIEYAIIEGGSGDIIIPKLSAMKIKDMVDIFAALYNKKVCVTNIRPGEKLHESLINETQSMRTGSVQLPNCSNTISSSKSGKREYYHIKPAYMDNAIKLEVFDYNSSQDILTKEELYEKLQGYNLLDTTQEYE